MLTGNLTGNCYADKLPSVLLIQDIHLKGRAAWYPLIRKSRINNLSARSNTTRWRVNGTDVQDRWK